jgi:hypothetical protein
VRALGFSAGMLGALVCFFIVRSSGMSFWEWIEKEQTAAGSVLVGFIVCAFFTISSFSTSFYPYVKPQFGGGQLSRVRVVLAEDKGQQIAKLGFPKSPVDLLAEAQLLDSTDKEFLIVVKSSADDRGVLLQLERDMVDTIMYLSPQ